MNDLIHRIRAAGIELRDGVTGAQLVEFQAALGAVLPADLAALYVDHDGMVSSSGIAMRMLSRAEVLRDTSAVRADDPTLLEPGAALFWTDDNSNYAGVFLNAPLAPRIFLFDHEEPDPAPRFFGVRSFVEHLLAQADDLLGNDLRDYPVTTNLGPTHAEDRRLALEFLRQHAAEPTNLRSAFLALALLPPDETHLALPLLASPDMWVQEQTCRLLGVRRHHQAMPPLVDVARNGQHNGKIAAIIALKHMRTHEADTALHHLERELGLAFAPYFRR
jgi:hypothetical protein